MEDSGFSAEILEENKSSEKADESDEKDGKEPATPDRETSQTENRMLVEAALFISGRSLGVKEILKAVPALTPARARNALESLAEENRPDSALEVSREVGAEIKYKMKVKDAYLSRVRRLSNFTDLSDGETKTLAVIAFYQPIKQSEIVKIRGNRAYEQVKNLIGAGLIVAEPKGITRILKTTERFSDYFGAPLESLRDKLDSRDKAIIDGAVEKAREEVSSEESDAPDRLGDSAEFSDRDKDGQVSESGKWEEKPDGGEESP